MSETEIYQLATLDESMSALANLHTSSSTCWEMGVHRYIDGREFDYFILGFVNTLLWSGHGAGLRYRSGTLLLWNLVQVMFNVLAQRNFVDAHFRLLALAASEQSLGRWQKATESRRGTQPAWGQLSRSLAPKSLNNSAAVMRPISQSARCTSCTAHTDHSAPMRIATLGATL